MIPVDREVQTHVYVDADSRNQMNAILISRTIYGEAGVAELVHMWCR